MQAATLGGTLVSLLKALRQAGVAERRRRLREATTPQLRIISAGLRLRVVEGSRAALMGRIEEALAQDARLAAPDQPIGRILRNFPVNKTDQFEELMIKRLSSAKLKGQPPTLAAARAHAFFPALMRIDAARSVPTLAPEYRRQEGWAFSLPCLSYLDLESAQNNGGLRQNEGYAGHCILGTLDV